MRRFLTAAFFAAVFCVFWTPGAFPAGDGFELVDSVAARVDEGVFLVSDLDAEEFFAGWRGKEAKMGRRELLMGMVKRRLLVIQAEKLRMEVPKEDVTFEVEMLSGAGYGADAFWTRTADMGVGRADVSRWARDVALARSFMALKRKSTYVAEADVRDFYFENRERFGDRPMSEARNEIREFLGDRKYEADLNAWMELQIKQGRVRVNDIPRTR